MIDRENVFAKLEDEHLVDVEAVTDPPGGKRAQAVAAIIDILCAAKEKGVGPVSQAFLLEHTGSDISQMGPAFLALELSGVVSRFAYVVGEGKPRSAFQIREGVEVDE